MDARSKREGHATSDEPKDRQDIRYLSSAGSSRHHGAVPPPRRPVARRLVVPPRTATFWNAFTDVPARGNVAAAVCAPAAHLTSTDGCISNVCGVGRMAARVGTSPWTSLCCSADSLEEIEAAMLDHEAAAVSPCCGVACRSRRSCHRLRTARTQDAADERPSEAVSLASTTSPSRFGSCSAWRVSSVTCSGPRCLVSYS